jgi:hypothetical protein
MKPITGPKAEAILLTTGTDGGADIEAEFAQELAQIEAESMGWQPLGQGAYLHLGSDAPVIEITGAATANMTDSNVLWIV